MKFVYDIFRMLLISASITSCAENSETRWSLELDKNYFLEASFNSRSKSAKDTLLENYNYGIEGETNYELFKEKATNLRNGFIYYELNKHSRFSTFTYFEVEGEDCSGESLGSAGAKILLKDCSFLTNIDMFYPLRDLRLRDDIVQNNIYNVVVVKIEDYLVVNREAQLVADMKLSWSAEDRLLSLFLGKTKAN